MNNPYQVVKDFEKVLCEYTGAPFCVATTSCTMALLLAVRCSIRASLDVRPYIEIPKRTYIGVPMSIIHAGGWPVFRDEAWCGSYQLKPLPVYDSARWLTTDLYNIVARLGDQRGSGMVCLSFHWTKTLAIGQGGAILLDDPEADLWLRRARFDGRREGVPASLDTFDMLGWHAYMSPRDAAEGLSRLAVLPEHNDPLTNSDYPDLSNIELFQ